MMTGEALRPRVCTGAYPQCEVSDGQIGSCGSDNGRFPLAAIWLGRVLDARLSREGRRILVGVLVAWRCWCF